MPLVVLWRLRHKLRLRDLAETFPPRGFVFAHEAVRDWGALRAPAHSPLARQASRPGRTFLQVDEDRGTANTTCCSRSHAGDRDGNLDGARLSATRAMAAAQRLFRQAVEASGRAPERPATDGHDAYPRASREALGGEVTRRTSRHPNDQDHRGVERRLSPDARTAARGQPYARVPPATQRRRFQGRRAAVLTGLAAA